MAKKSKLTQAAVKIGSAMGRAEGTARRMAKAGMAAKDELEQLSRQVDALKRQLVKTSKKLQRAMR